MSSAHPVLRIEASDQPEAVLAEAERSHAGRLVLGLGGLSFADGRGLRTLLDTSRREALLVGVDVAVGARRDD